MTRMEERCRAAPHSCRRRRRRGRVVDDDASGRTLHEYDDGDDGDDDGVDRTSYSSSSNTSPRPDRVTYNILIDSYTKWLIDHDVDLSREVEAVLLNMIALSEGAILSSIDIEQREYASRIRPDSITYNSVMIYPDMA